MFNISCRGLAVIVVVLLSVSSAWSARYRILHSFEKNSAYPPSTVIFDAAGNAYGTTGGGGFNKSGTVYQISPTGGYQIIYAFSGTDGKGPVSLTFDSAGNLYGATSAGGADLTRCGGIGCGTIFRLGPPKNGGNWTETTLHNFTGPDGAEPFGGVILDSEGNLYGSTYYGGSENFGVIYELVAGANDQWVENVLHSMTATDGENPLGSLVFDDSGSLYGTTINAGPSFGGAGTVFQLSLVGGSWMFSVIYAFDGSSAGSNPFGSLVFDTAGNLYGTADGGGEFNSGTVFELTPNQGSWIENTLYSFLGGTNGHDGSGPQGNLVFDRSGNLYGTTHVGGNFGPTCKRPIGCGTVFALVRGQNRQWSEKRFAFASDASQGQDPTAGVTLDNVGNLYGTTTIGGPSGYGVLFRITP